MHLVIPGRLFYFNYNLFALLGVVFKIFEYKGVNIFMPIILGIFFSFFCKQASFQSHVFTFRVPLIKVHLKIGGAGHQCQFFLQIQPSVANQSQQKGQRGFTFNFLRLKLVSKGLNLTLINILRPEASYFRFFFKTILRH